MSDLDGMRFHDAQGRPLFVDGPPTVVALLKGGAESTQKLYRIQGGGRSFALKVHEPRRFSRRIAATLGRPPIDHEMTMLHRAAAAGLAVPAVAGRGVKRKGMLVARSALLMSWCEKRRRLEDAAREAAACGDAATLDRGQVMLVDFLVRIRSAGLADVDFGAHNLLVPMGGPLNDAVWIDLEGAFVAPPEDPRGTVPTAGAALANWWCAMEGDQQRLIATFAAIRAAAPQPRGGWPQHLEELNAVVAKRVGKAIRYGWAKQLPAALEI